MSKTARKLQLDADCEAALATAWSKLTKAKKDDRKATLQAAIKMLSTRRARSRYLHAVHLIG